VPPEHTARAREILGPAELLVPGRAIVLETDRTRVREIARRHVRRYPSLPSYTNNLRRLGCTEEDLSHDGSGRLIDALVPWGDETAIARRVGEHRRAGADHVCLQVLDADFRGLPLPRWRRLAAVIPAGCRP
jgi:probable F420-dependent oxidoreductase